MELSFFSTLSEPQSPPREAFSIESGVYSEPCGDSVHAVFAPMHYEPGYAYPLIVWLHGTGNDERQLLRVMPLVSMRNYVAVAPRGTICREEKVEGVSTYGWQQTDRHIALAERSVFDCIELACTKYHVHRDRIFLAGFDSGGTMAFRIALAHPRRFRGIVSLGGALPTGRAPLGSLTDARRLPVLLAAGQHSTRYRPESVCADLRLLHTAGMFITLRQYPCGQEVCPQMLADLDRWMIEQITNPRPHGADPHAK